MKTLRLLCLFAFIFPPAGMAQEDTLALERGTIYAGYIITTDHDTIEGWLLNINLWLNQQMTFYYDDPDNHDERIKYKAKELKGYRVGNRIYEQMKYEGKYSSHKHNFFLREIDGPMSCYIWYYDPDRSKLSPVDMSLDDLSDAILFEEDELNKQLLILNPAGDIINLDQLKYLVNFDKNMSKLISDYPELADKVRNKKEGYKWINAKEIISEYNAWYLQNGK